MSKIAGGFDDFAATHLLCLFPNLETLDLSFHTALRVSDAFGQLGADDGRLAAAPDGDGAALHNPWADQPAAAGAGAGAGAGGGGGGGGGAAKKLLLFKQLREFSIAGCDKIWSSAGDDTPFFARCFTIFLIFCFQSMFYNLYTQFGG